MAGCAVDEPKPVTKIENQIKMQKDQILDYNIRNMSVMQKMLSVASENGALLSFTPESFDAYQPDSYHSIFEAALRASTIEGYRVSVRGLSTNDPMVAEISRHEDFFDHFSKLCAFGMTIEDAVKSVGFELVVDSSLYKFKNIVQDKNRNGMSLHEFFKYADAKMRTSQKNIHYRFLPEKKMIMILDEAYVFQLTPFKGPKFLKFLNNQGLSAESQENPDGSYQIFFTGDFESSLRAYEYFDNLNRFRYQTFGVFDEKNFFTLPEGFYPEKELSIESLGFTPDNKREYIVYLDDMTGNAKKIYQIKTSERVIWLKTDTEKKLAIRFF
jgi:hypothetical protein